MFSTSSVNACSDNNFILMYLPKLPSSYCEASVLYQCNVETCVTVVVCGTAPVELHHLRTTRKNRQIFAFYRKSMFTSCRPATWRRALWSHFSDSVHPMCCRSALPQLPIIKRQNSFASCPAICSNSR